MSGFRTGVGRYANKDVDPVKWNQAWERYLEKKFQPRLKYPDISFLSTQTSSLLSQPFLSGLEEVRKQLCALQLDLINFTATKRQTDNFDAKWLKMTAQTRENYILQGLILTCGAITNMENRREWCPETTTKYLQVDGGKGFLNLLSTICGPEVDVPATLTEPVLISHPVYDAMMDIGEPCPPDEIEAARAAMQRYSVQDRNYFITLFLWNTMLYIYGQSQKYLATKNGGMRTTGPERKEMVEERRNILTQKDLRLFKKEGKALVDTARWHCSACFRAEDELGAGKKFLVCSKCQTVGRRVKYCDRDCQMKDWKTGNPPHKAVCGQAISVPEAPEVTPVQEAQIPSTETVDAANVGPPPPHPDFVRSEALQRQVRLLQEHPGISYVLVEPAPKPDHGVRLPDSKERAYFESLRERAMTSGNLLAVAQMYDVLQDPAQEMGFSKARLLLQLSKEYDMEIEGLAFIYQTMKKKQSELEKGEKREEGVAENAREE